MKHFTSHLRRHRVLMACTIALLGTFTIAPWQTLAAQAAEPKPAAENARQQWGTLKGRFLYDGKPPEPVKLNVRERAFADLNLVDESLVVAKDGSLANVAIWVRQRDVPIHPSYNELKEIEATIQSTGGQFTPRVVPCWTGQPLELRNLDPVALNVHAEFSANDAFNVLLKPKSSQNGPTPAKVEPVPIVVTSNIQPWMKAWLIVQPHPYIAVTDREGRFEIQNLPAGMPLEFQVWHERRGFVTSATIDGKEQKWEKGRFTLTLKPEDTDLGEIKLAPQQFLRADAAR